MRGSPPIEAQILSYANRISLSSPFHMKMSHMILSLVSVDMRTIQILRWFISTSA